MIYYDAFYKASPHGAPTFKKNIWQRPLQVPLILPCSTLRVPRLCCSLGEELDDLTCVHTGKVLMRARIPTHSACTEHIYMPSTHTRIAFSYMYIIHVHAHIYIYIYIYVYTHMICIHTCIHTHTHTHAETGAPVMRPLCFRAAGLPGPGPLCPARAQLGSGSALDSPTPGAGQTRTLNVPPRRVFSPKLTWNSSLERTPFQVPECAYCSSGSSKKQKKRSRKKKN